MFELVDKIVLGTVQLGMDYGITNSYGKPEKLEALNILETAWENGIRRFDTAPGYYSEDILELEMKKIIFHLDMKNPMIVGVIDSESMQQNQF